MDRRNFLKTTTAASLVASLPNFAFAQTTPFVPKPGRWKSFDLITRIEITKPEGKMQAWVPLPSMNEAEWIKSGQTTWTTNAPTVNRIRDPKYRAEMLHVIWKNGESAPVLEVINRASMRDRAIDLSKPGKTPDLSDAERKLSIEGTILIPTDGIVKQTSDMIVSTVNAKTDLEKAKAIYNWVIENTTRNASTRGCGIGDIAAMLKTNTLTGKCADLNALFVGLARSQGLPARDVYGLRVSPSAFGYKSLGASSSNVTRAQHCRAEVHLTGFGWVPVDPADVRKVVLEEPPANLPLTDVKVVSARNALFGSWEGNWLAYNIAHDVLLPGANQQPLGFLMYPQAERAGLLLDCLDPDNFKYTITSKELTKV